MELKKDAMVRSKLVGKWRSVTYGALAIAMAQSVAAQQYKTTDDYPEEALRNRWQGTVAFTATVGLDGRAKDCTVTKSSGHEVLDKAACEIFMRRARFKPATDGQGNPKEATFSSKFNWRIP